MVDSSGTMLDGDSGSPQFSTCCRCSLMVPYHKRSYHGCFGSPGVEGSAISTINTLAAESVRQWQGQLECLHHRSTSSVGRNKQVGVLNRVYQTMSYLPLN